MAAAKPVRALKFDRLKVFSGNANLPLAEEMCCALGGKLGDALVKSFSVGFIPPVVEQLGLAA